MRNKSLKSVSARLSVTLFLLIGSMSTSAQYYLNVYEKSGSNNQYEIANLDSVSISDVKEIDTTPVLTVLSISQSEVNLETGVSTTLSIKGYDADGVEMTLENLKWKSSNYDVASVDEKGVVRTYQSGDALIIASIGEIADTCTVIITDHVYTIDEVVKLVVDKVALNVETGYRDSLSVRGFAADGVEIQLSNIQWRSNNKSVATVNDNGVVETLKSGNALIIASLNNILDTCVVTVVDHVYTLVDVVEIAIDHKSLDVELGDVVSLSAIGLSEKGVEIPLENVLWKSSNPSVVSIDEKGVIGTHNGGDAVIVAAFGYFTDTCVVTVTCPYTIADVAMLNINKSVLNLETGDMDTLCVKGFAADGIEIPLSGIVWGTDNPTVVNINSDGVICASNEGVAHIYALLGSVSDTCTLTVKMKYTDVGLYLGVMGFNKQLYTQPVSILNPETKTRFNNFIDGMEMENGTLLCYSVDNALDALHSIAIPKNLSTVAIVTFTDGLDEGSVKKISYNPYKTRTEYLSGIKNRISSDSVAGVPVTAYSIGLRGSDVTDVASFQSALKQLASKDSYAMEVENIDGVNAKFEQIARNLNRSINYQTVPIVIPGPDDGARLRFTFDIIKDNANSQDAASSSLYIEGTFNVEVNPLRYILSDIEYHGMDSLSGPVIIGEEVDEFLKFTFEKVLTNDSTFLSKDKIKEWYLTPDSLWQKNSEFKPDQQPDIVTKISSAIIMLVLDCSSSLDADFPKVQEKAKSFINILYSSYGTDYVDLGLSVKWATVNVGAYSPEDYGDYYAWDEIETKSSYTWTNYRFRTSGDSYSNVKFSKYNTSRSYGTVDNMTTIEMSDDVARQKWGGSWRMPTKDEFTELINNCTWTWTTLNGVNGYRVTSKKFGYTDRSIFLPAAGCRSGTSLDNAGSNGYYWSSSLVTGIPYNAWTLFFSSGRYSTSSNYRNYGRSVRPVCP